MLGTEKLYNYCCYERIEVNLTATGVNYGEDSSFACEKTKIPIPS